MATNRLTDKQCRAFKPGAKPTKHADGGGLYLLVKPSGAKLWQCAYRWQGKQQTASFGPFPATALESARDQRDGLQALLKARVDPRTSQPKAEGASDTPAPDGAGLMTLDVATSTYWAGRQDTTKNYREDSEGMMRRHLPGLMPRDLATITRKDVMTALEPLDTAGKFTTVRNVLMWLRNVLDWAVQHEEKTGLVQNVAAYINPGKAFGSREVKHFAALELDEVGEFLRLVDFEGRRLQSVLATRLMAYTWVRTKELRSIEPGHIKRAPAGWEWRVPGSVMKMKEELIVPLPRQALAIIEELRARMQPGQTYMLPNYRSPMTAAMSENAVLELVYRLGYKGKMTGHGWRTVASTWANERTNYKADAIERQLAHSPKKGQGGATRAAYNRAKYLAERREMMQAWADWLDAEQAKAEKRSKEPKAAKRARVPAVALAR